MTGWMTGLEKKAKGVSKPKIESGARFQGVHCR